MDEKMIELSEGSYLDREHPFTDYMRSLRESRQFQWKDVAERIDFQPRYLYKIISGEKVTRQRDQILRIGFGMELTLEELQQALTLYGFAPLYVRRRRDVLLMKLVQDKIYEISAVDSYLTEYGELPLQTTRSAR